MRVFALAVLATLLLAAPASAFKFGVADNNSLDAFAATQLGATTYRVIMDPNQPLDVYAPRIEAYRSAGIKPQLTVGGTGTKERGKNAKSSRKIIRYAVAAFKRWPDAYSVNVVNEPDLAGGSACRYVKTFKAAYKTLHRAGVRKVQFGELSPAAPIRWTVAMSRCGNKRVVADEWTWHCYDVRNDWVGIKQVRSIRNSIRHARRLLHTPKGKPLPVGCTEYGAMTRGKWKVSEATGARKWRYALKMARKYKLTQIIAWGIHEEEAWRPWDMSLITPQGRIRPAFDVIAADKGHR